MTKKKKYKNLAISNKKDTTLLKYIAKLSKYTK